MQKKKTKTKSTTEKKGEIVHLCAISTWFTVNMYLFDVLLAYARAVNFISSFSRCDLNFIIKIIF